MMVAPVRLRLLGHDETSGDTLIPEMVEELDSVRVPAVPTEVDTGPFEPLDTEASGLGLPYFTGGDVRQLDDVHSHDGLLSG